MKGFGVVLASSVNWRPLRRGQDIVSILRYPMSTLNMALLPITLTAAHVAVSVNWESFNEILRLLESFRVDIGQV